MVVFEIEGLKVLDEKLLGPLQLYVAEGWVLVPEIFNISPAQIGLLLEAIIVGAIVEFTTALLVVLDVQPLYVAVRV